MLGRRIFRHVVRFWNNASVDFVLLDERLFNLVLSQIGLKLAVRNGVKLHLVGQLLPTPEDQQGHQKIPNPKAPLWLKFVDLGRFLDWQGDARFSFHVLSLTIGY